MTLPALYDIRPGRETDHPFVISSWLASDRHSPAGRDMGERYASEHRETVKRILMRAELRVACVVDTPDAILGWAVTGPDTVYYVYVRRDVRRLGIGRALVGDLAKGQLEYTHRPVTRGEMKLPEGWTYNVARNYR